MDLQKQLQILFQISLLFEELEELDPGEETEVPAIALKVGKERWEIGPIKAKRTR